MSLARQFFREMRPFFRMLDEASLTRPRPMPYFPSIAQFDPFPDVASNRPALDLSDKGDKYVVEADVPGIPKENVQIRVGDGGQSITIEGKVEEKGAQPAITEASDNAPAGEKSNNTSTSLVNQNDSATQISSERPFTRSMSFTRTVWLPRPVDTKNVSASMKDGVLTITVPKAEDKSGTVIPID